jgi:hypothetical protein
MGFGVQVGVESVEGLAAWRRRRRVDLFFAIAAPARRWCGLRLLRFHMIPEEMDEAVDAVGKVMMGG